MQLYVERAPRYNSARSRIITTPPLGFDNGDDAGGGEDGEFKRLLELVSDKGLKALSQEELDLLRAMLERKDYAGNKKADRSRKKLLKQINAEIYNRYAGRSRFPFF